MYCVCPPRLDGRWEDVQYDLPDQCAALRSSDAALAVTLVLVSLILSGPGEPPTEAFLRDGLSIGLEKPGCDVRPITIKTCYRFAGVCALRAYGSGTGAGLAPLQV